MTKPQTTIYDAQTGEVTVRDLTAEEIAALPTSDEVAPTAGQRHACIRPDRLRNNTPKRTSKSTQQRINPL